MRVRVFSAREPGKASVSTPFVVGNTPPEVSFGPSSDQEGDVTIIISAHDAEGDPLEDVQVFHTIPPSLAVAEDCGSRGGLHRRPQPSSHDAGAAQGMPRVFSTHPGEAEKLMVLRPELPSRLEFPTQDPFIFIPRNWDSIAVTGSRNAPDLRVRLECRDPFGQKAGAIVLRQFNPGVEFEVPMERVKHIHTIVPWDDVLSF